jgi:L-iditol 2-dehydrogenase
VHYLEHGRIGDFVVEGDFILGHECSGVVVETGKNVKRLKAGDRVALEPGVPCGQCEFCRSGKYNLCPDVEFLATPPYHGCLMNYIAFPENMAFKLPDNVSTKEGALVEPLAVGLHAAAQGNVRLGDKVVILGAGTIGLVTLLACKAYGATEVTVVDVIEKRLEVAKNLGATRVINAKDENAVETVMALTNGVGVDKVIETAGNEHTIKQCPYLVKRGGTIVLVGLAPKDIIDFNFMQIMVKEADIKTVFRYRNLYPSAIGAIADGKINVKGIVTHEFDFEESDKAFDFVIENKNEVVKAVIKI